MIWHSHTAARITQGTHMLFLAIIKKPKPITVICLIIFGDVWVQVPLDCVFIKMSSSVKIYKI